MRKPNNKCLFCNNDFYARPSAIARGEGKYCSFKCYLDAHNKKTYPQKRNCFFCKIEFEITEPRYRNRKYCSQSCAAKYSNSKRTGCKYNSRDTFRLSLLKEHGHQCMVKDCYYKHFVDAHHIEKKSKGGSNDAIKNGILLCPNHHREADAGVLTPEKLHEYKSEFCSNGLRV